MDVLDLAPPKGEADDAGAWRGTTAAPAAAANANTVKERCIMVFDRWVEVSRIS